MCDILDAGTILQGVQVVVPYNHGAGVTRVQFFEQFAHGSLLCRRSRVGGLTADVIPALVADADRVGGSCSVHRSSIPDGLALSFRLVGSRSGSRCRASSPACGATYLSERPNSSGRVSLQNSG